MADKHTTKEYIARQFKNFKTYIDKIYLPTNKKTLDGFSESSEGGLLWNNEPIEGGSGGSSEAIDINYNNSTSGLDSGNVQDAIDELDETIDDNKINYELDESGTGLTISGPGFGGSPDGSSTPITKNLIINRLGYTPADEENVYTKSEVDALIPEVPDISVKADKSETYTKSEVDALIPVVPDISVKADKSETYTKSEVDALIPDISNKLDNDGNADSLYISSYMDKDIAGNGSEESSGLSNVTLSSLFSKISDIIFDLRKSLRSKLESTSSITDTTVSYTESNISGEFISSSFETKSIKAIIERLQDKILGNTQNISNVSKDVAKVNTSLTAMGSYNGKTKIGYYKNADGTYVGTDSHGICIDDIVPCSQGDVVEIQTDVAIGSANIVFLKADKTFLSSTGDIRTAPYSATVPSNAKYFVCGVYNGDVSNLNANIYLRKNNVLINNASVGVSTLHSNLTDLAYGDVAGGKNLIDFNSRITDAYLNNSTGEVVKNSSSVGYWASPFVPVKGGEKYAIDNVSNSDIYWYDSNRSLIIKNQSVGFNNLVTAPSNAKFLRFDCNDKTTIHSNPIIVENDSTIPYEPYIMSNKQLSALYDSSADYGLDNKFDGTLLRGVYVASGYVDTGAGAMTNKYSCVAGKPVHVNAKLATNHRYWIAFLNSSDAVVSAIDNPVDIIVPTNATSFVICAYKDGGGDIDKKNIYYLAIYYDNAIDRLSNISLDTETKIGTFNGKDLFRRVIKTTTTSGSQVYYELGVYIDTILRSEFLIKSKSTGTIGFAPYYVSNTDWASPYLVEDMHRLALRGGSSYGFGDYTIVLEYTKQ